MTQQTEERQKATSKEEAFSTARRLVQEAVDVANKAGIDPSSVLAPHCSESAVKDNNGGGDEGKTLNWCGVPVIINNNTDGLFEMPTLNDDLEQKPAFLVTQATADLVRPDFERYQPSLERMLEDWQDEKNQFMREQANRKRDDKKSAKRSEIKRRK
ncbi:MAG: hypothetical protein QOH25_2159 [Acidobacteriota bacterium]|nr:hypothetical protein [Acidobacteriota bacterium]